jgi:2-polyprenyl-3-methyl-5-hydroxy-6-metoxy-1,4-benzoquinol methylase
MFSRALPARRVRLEYLLASPYQLKSFKYNSHYWLLKFLAEDGRPKRILDVGTADGYLGALLKREGHMVVGVERDPVLAEKARAYYDRFHLGDIEEFDFPYRSEFDAILFADVLEHLRDPSAVLSRALSALKPGGEILISVPNVANFTVRLGLLFGLFNYAERGILDRTHLRFFTLTTLRQMVVDCGYQCRRIVPTPVPVQLVIPYTDHPMLAPLHELHYLVVRLWRRMFAYQFIVCATRV